MAWRRPGANPLSEPMIIRLPTQICVIRIQWVNNVSTYNPTWDVDIGKKGFVYKYHVTNKSKCLMGFVKRLDSFKVPLHSPNCRQLPGVRVVHRDYHWGLKNGGNSHWSRESIMRRGIRQSQSIFRPTNWMPANWRPCLIPPDSLIATRPGLCGSLWKETIISIQTNRLCRSTNTLKRMKNGKNELLVICRNPIWLNKSIWVTK